MKKTTQKKSKGEVKTVSPRIAHVDFYVDKERTFYNYVRYLSNPLNIMWRNFLVGTFQGLGFVLGTAILLTIIGFVFGNLLTQIPLLKDFSQALQVWIEQNISK